MSLFPDIDNTGQRLTGSAVISADGLYRYELRRSWGDPELPPAVFIGLNPSTADASLDDPTLRRCIGFAKRLSFDSMVMVNLFAYRATRPEEMMAAPDPVGPENNRTLLSTCLTAGVIIACWGTLGTHKGRDRTVTQLLTSEGIHLKCLGLSAGGHPRHPLYLRGNAELIDFNNAMGAL